jgi:hypothetical protein
VAESLGGALQRHLQWFDSIRELKITKKEKKTDMFDINEIKKDLYRSKNMAKFSHYQSGNLFYTVEIAEGIFQFPITTVEKITKTIDISHLSNEHDKLSIDNVLILSEDLGITPFNVEIKGSELSRWIQKAIKNEQFIKVA